MKTEEDVRHMLATWHRLSAEAHYDLQKDLCSLVIKVLDEVIDD